MCVIANGKGQVKVKEWVAQKKAFPDTKGAQEPANPKVPLAFFLSD